MLTYTSEIVHCAKAPIHIRPECEYVQITQITLLVIMQLLGGQVFANALQMPVFQCIQIKCNPIYLLWIHGNGSTQESLYWFGLNCHMGSLSVTTMPRMQPTNSYSSRWWWWWSWPCWWLYQMAVARMSWMHPKKLYRSQYVSSVAKSIQLSHPDLLMSKRF